jgi:hypothetical protein
MKTRSLLTRTRRAAATPTLADKKRLIIEAEQAEQTAADANVDQSFAAVYDREYKR